MSDFIRVYISDDTEARLKISQAETGMSFPDLMESAVENYVNDLFRHRKDDPTRSKALGHEKEGGE